MPNQTAGTSNQKPDMPTMEIDASVGVTDKEAAGATETTPQKEEKSTPPASSSEKISDNAEESASERKAIDVAHKHALSAIETVFSDKFTDEERVEYFNEHPELAKVANRSKRFKDDYRKLENVKAISPSNVPSKVSIEKDETDDDPQIDDEELMSTLTSEISARVMEEQLKTSRRSTARDFAERNGFNEEEYKNLYKIAESIHSSSSTDYEKALVAASVALGKETSPVKKAVNLKSGDSSTSKSDVDAKTEISKIAARNGISEENATIIYERIKKFEEKGGFESGAWF